MYTSELRASRSTFSEQASAKWLAHIETEARGVANELLRCSYLLCQIRGQRRRVHAVPRCHRCLSTSDGGRIFLVPWMCSD